MTPEGIENHWRQLPRAVVVLVASVPQEVRRACDSAQSVLFAKVVCGEASELPRNRPSLGFRAATARYSHWTQFPVPA
jgi:hypothetical protein